MEIVLNLPRSHDVVISSLLLYHHQRNSCRIYRYPANKSTLLLRYMERLERIIDVTYRSYISVFNTAIRSMLGSNLNVVNKQIPLCTIAIELLRE